ncbi:MAG: MoaD/ThiS family protein [Usitatibacteraceae bacterium]
MRVTLKLFASLSDYLPAGTKQNRVDLDLADDTSVDAALAPFAIPPALTHLVLVNGVFIPREDRAKTTLRESDAVAVWPPIAGG